MAPTTLLKHGARPVLNQQRQRGRPGCRQPFGALPDTLSLSRNRERRQDYFCRLLLPGSPTRTPLDRPSRRAI